MVIALPPRPPHRPQVRPLVLGLYSAAPACGKSTVAAALEADGFVRVPFAATLKAMARVLLEAIGYEPLFIGELLSVRKEVPLDALDGVTVRHLLQTLGTDWGRQQVHQELWLRCWQGQVERLLAAGRNVVADDVRFANEARTIEELGGAMVQVHRPAQAVQDVKVLAHASEGGLSEWCFAAEIWNNGAIEDLAVQARQLVRSLEG
jgi:hypothetical protein